ncbi:MAG TPA: hypothetical protein VL882_23655 [Vicinamibacterales bacterium]|nr:hypothetical protein [Vicinamibacterales bacterium]
MFARPELSAKPRAVPEGPFGQLCVSGLANEEWSPLLQMAADFGFPSA